MRAPLDRLRDLAPVDEAAAAAARDRQEALAKPPGSLGDLEGLGSRLAAIAGTCPPPVPATPVLVICAGDHGVHAQRVTPWPQAITALMVDTFGQGRAAANAIAGVTRTDVHVLDVGVAGDVRSAPRLHRSRVRAGTRDLAVAAAMTHDEVLAAIQAGADLTGHLVDGGADLVVTGDMGIANTTPSGALIAAFTNQPAEAVTGRGTGIDDAMLAHKTAVVARALARHGPVDPDAPLDTLASLGGLEHAALVGVMLAAAKRRVPVLLDGVIANAAAVAGVAIAPHLGDYLVAGHRSVEPGARLALDHLGLTPLVDLGLRLGEGTGALLAVPIVQAAAAVLHQMATLADLGVSTGG